MSNKSNYKNHNKVQDNTQINREFIKSKRKLDRKHKLDSNRTFDGIEMTTTKPMSFDEIKKMIFNSSSLPIDRLRILKTIRRQVELKNDSIYKMFETLEIISFLKRGLRIKMTNLIHYESMVILLHIGTQTDIFDDKIFESGLARKIGKGLHKNKTSVLYNEMQLMICKLALKYPCLKSHIPKPIKYKINWLE